MAESGFFRGRVVSTSGRRAELLVPQILGTARTNWAEPMQHLANPVRSGDLVWVTFHGGDLSKPMYLPDLVVEGWSSVSYTNGWSAFGTTWPVGFYKDPLGMVHLRGIVKVPTTAPTSAQPIFILPPTYAPDSPRLFFQGNQSGTPQRVDVAPDGAVKVNTPIIITAGQWVVLDNIHFRSSV